MAPESEGVPRRGRETREGLEPGAMGLEVLPLGVELFGEPLPLGLEVGDAVGFGLQTLEGAGCGCFGAGGCGAEVGELAVRVLEPDEVFADEGGDVGRVNRWRGLSWDGSGLAVVGAAVGGLEALEDAGCRSVPDGAFGDSEGGRKARGGLPCVRVVGRGLVDDFGGVAHVGEGAAVGGAGKLRRRRERRGRLPEGAGEMGEGSRCRAQCLPLEGCRVCAGARACKGSVAIAGRLDADCRSCRACRCSWFSAVGCQMADGWQVARVMAEARERRLARHVAGRSAAGLPRLLRLPILPRFRGPRRAGRGARGSPPV